MGRSVSVLHASLLDERDVVRAVYRYTADVSGDRTVKTAVSLPQRLFEATERAARRRGVPRSRIFVEALEHHLADEEESDITAQINASLARPLTREEAEEEAAAEGFAAEAARRLLPDWEWKGDQSG
jgi:hypothetical protein